MTTIEIRNANESDFECVLRLNDVEVQQTSQMDLDRLRQLDQLSDYHKVAVAGGTKLVSLQAAASPPPRRHT